MLYNIVLVSSIHPVFAMLCSQLLLVWPLKAIFTSISVGQESGHLLAPSLLQGLSRLPFGCCLG